VYTLWLVLLLFQLALSTVTVKIQPATLPQFSQYTIACTSDVVNTSTIQVINGFNVMLSYDAIAGTFSYGSDANTLQVCFLI